MTDKELAEEWCKENMDICKEECGIGEAPYFTAEERCIAKSAFIDGFNADRWHYTSRGEYPTEGETVLVAFQEGGPWYFADAEYHEGGWASAADLGHIIAWQYIIPPKEEE